MAFTNETKYGLKDGDQIANWGSQYPVFARVKDGKLYAVAREDRPDHPTPGRFGSMFMCSREWLRSTIFAAFKSYADVFEDKPNNVQDTSEPGSSFIKVSSVEGIVKAPVLDVNPTMILLPGNSSNPTTSTPAKTDTTTPATTTTSTNPLIQAFQSGTGQTSGTTGSASVVRILGIVAAVVFMLGGLYFLVRSRK